jgi:iron(III) transport system substrate-binding protein
MNDHLGQKMQQAFAKLGLLPVTTEAFSEADSEIDELQKSKLLGTTDPERMNQMLELAKQIYG